MKKLTLYHPSSSGSGWKQWSIWLEKDRKTVTVEWGKVGHTLQTSSDTAKPKGKPGTASYMDEHACALFNIERQTRKKREEGYTETMGEERTDETRDIFNGLDKQFVPAKPRTDVELDDLWLPWSKGELVAQRKRNGQRHITLITASGEVRIYSRRLDDLTDHFPLLCKRIKALKLPKRTIIDGEIYIERPDGTDDFKAVQTITRAKAAKAASREELLIDQIRYMIFDVLYFAGMPLWQKPYSRRYADISANLPVEGMGTVFIAPLLYPDEWKGSDPAILKLTKRAKKDGWEGIVFWCWNEPTIVRDGGKPKRTGCIKWKVKQDYDVIATGFFYGSGKRSDVVGGFNIAEYDEDGNLRDCGKCGSGLDMETAADALTWDYPLVIKIESDGQEPTGKFIFPVFVAVHEDKTPEEVIGQDLSELE